MDALTPLDSLPEAYPDLHSRVEATLRIAGHEPADFVVTHAVRNGERLEASYYPRAVAHAHGEGQYDLPAYQWVAVDSTILPDGRLESPRIKLLEAEGVR